MSIKQVLIIATLCVSIPALAQAQQAVAPLLPAAPVPQVAAQAAQQPGTINGTVTDSADDAIVGAMITVTGATPTDVYAGKSNDNGFFEVSNLPPGTYNVTVTMKDFSDWKSAQPITLRPGQNIDIPDIAMQVGSAFTVTALYTQAEIATQEVKVEEEQRVLGVLPNFYVTYDRNPVALTVKLKFQLALKSTLDPATFVAANMYAGMNQAADRPGYVEGAKGYGQRLGSAYADGFTDILFGGAILPSLLHQDPRYFYNGQGTKTHRFFYAVATPFICKGDNGKWQPNYSSIGGDLISGAISNTYYPDADRGAGLVLTTAAIGAGGRAMNALMQEFVLRKLTTSKGKKQPQN